METKSLSDLSATNKQVKIIVMEGELTLERVENIENTLFNAIRDYDGIQLQLKNVQKLDLRVIQLLYAFRRASETENKEFEIEMHLPEEIQESLNKSGLNEKFNQSSIS